MYAQLFDLPAFCDDYGPYLGLPAPNMFPGHVTFSGRSGLALHWPDSSQHVPDCVTVQLIAADGHSMFASLAIEPGTE